MLRNCEKSRIGFSKTHKLYAQFYATKAKLNTPAESENKIDTDWNDGIPFSKIPGPSVFALIMANLPGGKMYNKPVPDALHYYRKKYGDILKFPGVFGKNDLVITFEPANFEKVFRTEGVWPTRRGLDSITYYRTKVRPDIYFDGGLVAMQGKEWSEFRTQVNPVMMQPKTVKLYVPKIDEVAIEFIERMRKIRNPQSLEMPENFEEELNRCFLESIGVIALDTRLNLIGNFDQSSRSNEMISALKTFFELMMELDFKPSLWKIVATPNFKKYIAALEVLTEITQDYINEAKVRLEKAEKRPDHEESVLEKLLKIDPKIAQIMASDMLIAGVDTTTAAFTSVMYQLSKNTDKQSILRDEIRTILPTKDAPLTSEKMARMPYLRACIKEALRMTPVTLGNFRTTGQDVVLSGYQVHKGVDVSMITQPLLIDTEHFAKANEYIPERWLRERSTEAECPAAKTTSPFIFLPFGFGPRMCIGKRFADLEVEVLVTRIVRNFYVEWNRPDLKFKSVAINLPDDNLEFKTTDVLD